MKDLSLHILDILQNSTRAGATKIELSINKQEKEDLLTLTFKDNGCGMDEETMKKVTDPFFTTRTTRKVGLGLPLLKQNAEMTGGSFSIASAPNKGTEVICTFKLSHIDLKPMGDIPGAVILTVSAHPDVHFIFHYQNDHTDYLFDTQEIYEALDGMSIQNPEIMQYLKEMIEENMQ